jgi:ribosomal protein S18 acetylase RimI-like enzyme
VAVLTPYFPYPLSHGGAVRIFHMLAEAAKDFDIFLFSFTDSLESTDPGPLTALCAQINVVPNTRYREPRWASLNPPEVGEFHSSTMVELLEKAKREQAIQLLQVEYTHMASYGGDILVEHDVTFDLQRQVHARRKSITSWWNLWRWTRYECRALRRYRSVVVMSEKDAALLQATNVQVIPNGVDLSRFRPLPEPSGARLLFVGSFRHFPNIVAYRYLTERVWPLLRQAEPDVRLTVVAGPDPDLHWKTHAGSATPYFDDRIERHSFVADVKPLYDAANLVVVPTEESAGTNLKVLEALAMERAVVSTSSGCAGLGLEHGVNVWIADTPEAFAQGILHLLCDHELRRAIALAGRVHAENHFDWTRLGVLQRQLWNELLPKQDLRIRRARSEDLNSIQAIQLASGLAAQWEPGSYFAYDVLIAEYHGEPAGFLVSRTLGHGEVEVLTIAVHEHLRRLGVATQLIAAVSANEIFLEVRESNGAARNLYRKMKFQELGIRKDYYEDPTENAVIMRLSRKLNRVNF